MKFYDILTNEVEIFQLPTNYTTVLSIHPLEPYFSITEKCNMNPKVYIYSYPQKTKYILKDPAKLEIQHSTFSCNTYYATVSGIPDFILSIWEFRSGELLCKTNLNGLRLTTFSFCSTDWHYLLGTDHRCIHVWQIETCNQMNSIQSNSMILPEYTVNIGLYYGLNNTGFSEDATNIQHGTRFDPKLTESAITGVSESKKEEFDSYMDTCIRLNCVSQAWTNSKLAFIGCEGGQLLLFDPINMNMKILLNPASHCVFPKDGETIESTPEKIAGSCDSDLTACSFAKSKIETINTLEGCLTYLLYTMYGLLAGGSDGILRLLILDNTETTGNKQGDHLSVRKNGTSSLKMNENLSNTVIKNCINLYEYKHLITNDKYYWAKSITGLSIASSYERTAVSSRLGHLNVFTLHDPRQFTFSPDVEISTNCDPYVGMGLITTETSVVCVTARNIGIINCWDCKTGRLLSSLFLNDVCYCMKVSPILPLAVAGMRSGNVVFIDCSVCTSPRIINMVRLYRKPLTHISFDPDGEFLTTVIDDGPNILMSALPTRSFEPVGYVSFTGRVHSLSMIRSRDSMKTFVLLAVGKDTNKTADAVYQYEIPNDIINDNAAHYVDNYRKLNEEKIKLIKLNFNRPKIGVCYWPPNDVYESTSPLLIAADFKHHALEIFIVNESHKQQRQSHIYTEDIYNILQETENIKFTRVPGTNLLLAHCMDGLIHMININETVSLQYSISIHESNSRGVIAAEFCKELNSLITCGGDGLLARIKLSEDIIMKFTYSPFTISNSLPEQLARLKEMTDYKKDQNQSHLNVSYSQESNILLSASRRSSPESSLPNQPLPVNECEDIDLKVFSHFKTDTDSDAITWIELCQHNVEASEDLLYTETKMNMLNELTEIKNTVNAMVSENESLPEIQRISRLEFELDTDEQNVILEETKATVNQLRKEINLGNLAKQFIWKAIKTQCWDEMSVKGRWLKAFNLPIKVSNYPLKNLSHDEKQLINTVVARIKIIRETTKEKDALSSHLFQQNVIKKTSQEQKEEVDEEEEQEQSINRVLAGST
ncbi:Cilia- and flagella-associated protein, partial [Schistosoma japonicum]